MYFPALIIFGSLATAIQPPIVPFFQQAPTPQWGAMKLGVYRFVNLVSGTAISMNDSSADSLIVARPVADNDNAQRWHLVNPTIRLGTSIVNNGTGQFISATAVGQPVRAKTVCAGDRGAIWIVGQQYFGIKPTDPLSIRILETDTAWVNAALEVVDGNSASGTPVSLAKVQGGKRTQGWYPQYLGEY